MKVKTSELTGAALDWAVAKCEGFEAAFTTNKEVVILREGVTDYFDPHRNWGWGGPIIERELIGTGPRPEGSIWPEPWLAASIADDAMFWGATPLIAAMRCCCAKLGEFVDIPEELCQQESN